MTQHDNRDETPLERFTRIERENDRQLKTYLSDAHSNYQTLTVDQRKQLESSSAKFLHANTCEAHIAVAGKAATAASHIEGCLAEGDPLHWVTIVTGLHAATLEEAPNFDITRLQAFGRQMLRGFDFFGIIEPAFYGNFRLDPTDKGRATISWHMHAVVWNASEKEVRRRCSEINSRYQALIPGPTAAHRDNLPTEDLHTTVLYMMKGQRSEYRVYPKMRELTDPETGEITKEATGHFKQRKRDLRPGDRARMVRVLEHHLIDRMLFAGGHEGKEVLADFQRIIRQPWERFKRDHNAKAGPYHQWT